MRNQLGEGLFVVLLGALLFLGCAGCLLVYVVSSGTRGCESPKGALAWCGIGCIAVPAGFVHALSPRF